MLHLTKIKLGVPVKFCEKCHISLGMLSQCTVRRNTMCCGCWFRSDTIHGCTGKRVVYKHKNCQKETERVAEN